MSRFSEASVACLKRVMLSRTPDFSFKVADLYVIMQETGLNLAQIRVWAENFRMRYATEKDRMDFLTSEGFEKVMLAPATPGKYSYDKIAHNQKIYRHFRDT